MNQQLPVKALLKLNSHGSFTRRVWVRVHVHGRRFHSACKGSLAGAYGHVGQLVRQELLDVQASKKNKKKRKKEKHDQVSKFCFTFQRKSAKTCQV